VDLSGTTTAVSGAVALANGGTGQTTKAPAFDALSPLTAQGDLLVGGASGTGTRLPVSSTVGDILTSNGTTAAWTTPSSASASGDLTALLDLTGGGPTVITTVPGSNNTGVTLLFTGSFNDGEDITLPSAASYATTTSSKTLTLINPTNESIDINSTDSAGNAAFGPGNSASTEPTSVPSTSGNLYNESITLKAIYNGVAYVWYQVAHSNKS